MLFQLMGILLIVNNAECNQRGVLLKTTEEEKDSSPPHLAHSVEEINTIIAAKHFFQLGNRRVQVAEKIFLCPSRNSFGES